MNEKLPPDLVARITADIKAAVETDDFRHLLAEVAIHQMGPRFAMAGISPRTAIGKEISASLMATVEVAAEAGIHAYLAHTLDVPLGDLIEVILPESYAEAKADVDRDDPTDALVDALRSALEAFLASSPSLDAMFADEFERDAYRELRPEIDALDHSACGVGGCAHGEWAEAELGRRAAERRARAAQSEPDPEPIGINAASAPLTPEQQDRRYPGLPRGSDD